MKKAGSYQSRMKKTLLTFTLAGTMVLSSSPFALAAATPVKNAPISYAIPELNGGSGAAHDNKVVKRVEAQRAIEHVKYLSETIGPRPGGLEAEKQAADYVSTTLKSYGYEVEYQYFPVADQLIANVSFADGSSWQMGAAANGKISDVPVNSEVIYVEDGTKASD